MIRRPPRSTPLYSSAASDVYKRQVLIALTATGDDLRVLGQVNSGKPGGVNRNCVLFAQFVGENFDQIFKMALMADQLRQQQANEDKSILANQNSETVN